MRNHLPPPDRVAALDEQLARMRIGGHISIRVTDQDEITVSLEFVAGVSNDTVIGRLVTGVEAAGLAAGQRNDGMAPLGSAALTAVSVVCGSSLATCADCAGAALATLIFFSAGAVRGSATLGAAGGWAAATW